MSYGGLPRDYSLPSKDPDKEDESNWVNHIEEHLKILGQQQLTMGNDFWGVDYAGLPGWGDSSEEDEKEECDHEWKKVQLVVSTVEICEKCGIKKKGKK